MPLVSASSGSEAADRVIGFQTSNRGGRVGLRLAGDRVHLTGGAVTVMRGELDAG